MLFHNLIKQLCLGGYIVDCLEISVSQEIVLGYCIFLFFRTEPDIYVSIWLLI
ncbi:hypothetical protein PRJH_p079 (plasmid) [Providencia rustigianii]